MLQKPPSSPAISRARHMPALGAAVHYQISAPDRRTHLFHINLSIALPAAQQELLLPVWIPGSYLIREFARHLQQIRATQQGHACKLVQLDKHRWQVQCKPGAPLQISYAVHAHDHSVRGAWLDAERGFFNPACLCLQVVGQAAGPHQISIAPIAKGWQVATGLEPVKTDKAGFGSYTAPDYDTLADSPVELGAFWSGHFDAYGVPHRLVIATPPAAFDGERLLRDVQRICEAEMRFWQGGDATVADAPFDRYVFMLNAVDTGYGGLEHANSTALIASRKTLPRVGETPGDGYTTLLGLVSHEYFHAWNVKRLRPAALAPYDYSRENYTELLWFFEGFTSYYDDLLLLRAGCIDGAGYLAQLNKGLDNVRATPGRAMHSVAQASFEAWTKYYRPDANTPNSTVSYYTKGALVALCFDLGLRAEGKTTLDAVMRALYRRCFAAQKPLQGMTEADFADVIRQLGGRSFAREIRQWVHGTQELPIERLLAAHGVRIAKTPAPLAQQWGLRCKEGGGITVQTVLRGGVAEAAGFSPGDEWLGVEFIHDGQPHGWRVGSLHEVQQALPAAPQHSGNAVGYAVTALVARDKRLLRLPMHIPAGQPMQQWKLEFATPPGKRAHQRWPWR